MGKLLSSINMTSSCRYFLRNTNISVILYLLSLHLLAVLAIWFHTLFAIILCVVFYLVTGFGVTVGYHRLLTHCSFKTSRWLMRCFATAGTLAGQGGPLFWVSTHRMHHLASDQDGDPHDARRGFVWAHMAWTIMKKKSLQTDQQCIKDLRSDPFLCWLDCNDLYLQLLLASLIFLGTLLLKDLYAAVSALIWAVPFRIVVVLHCTWLTNSAAHLWGYRRFSTTDQSRNNWWVALLTLGEGWHNNHHAFPGSARHGLAWFEFDPSWLLIKFLHTLGLVTQVKVAASSPSKP